MTNSKNRTTSNAKSEMPASPFTLRWLVTLTYQTKRGEQVFQRRIDEMSELHDIVEDGPNFCLLKSVVINANPKHFTEELVHHALIDA